MYVQNVSGFLMFVYKKVCDGNMREWGVWLFELHVRMEYRGLGYNMYIFHSEVQGGSNIIFCVKVRIYTHERYRLYPNWFNMRMEFTQPSIS